MDMARTEGMQQVLSDGDHALSPHSATAASALPRVWSGWLVLRWLLPLALLHGLLYMAIVPPWQHYDEPAHFEYVRWLVTAQHQSSANGIATTTNREILDSMYRFRFMPPGARPDLISDRTPAVGISQEVHPPLYYALAAVPVRWVQYLPIEVQLYAARLVGVLLLMLTVLCAWRLGTILAPDQPLLQLALPLLLITVPAFSDMMSAVNNDVLVNFATAVLLLGCVLLIRDGPRLPYLALATLGLMVGVFSKRTAVIALLPFLLALFWSLQRRPLRWWFWLLGISLLLLLGSVAAFRINPLAEPPGGVLGVRPWLAELDRLYLRLSIDATLHSLTNWERSWQVYPTLFNAAFMTFWQRFGWGEVRMPPFWEWATALLVLGASAGLLIKGLRDRANLATWQKRCIWLCLLMVIIAWLAVIVRVHPLPPPGIWPYIPRGRYMHLAMLPMLWLLILGVQGLCRERWQGWAVLVLVAFFVLLDTVAWAYTLLQFYYLA